MYALLAAAANQSQEGGSRQQRRSAVWTLLGTILLLTIYAVWNRGFQDFFPVMADLLTGDVEGARHHATSLVRMAPVVAAAVVVMLTAAAVTLPIITARVKRLRPNFKAPNMFDATSPKRQFATIMALLLGEELWARQLFLGQTEHFRSAVAFYLLFLLGNGTWALVHIWNYQGENKVLRHPVMVLPQFVAGVMLTGVYVSFGLIGALLAHVAYDMVLFAMDRRDVFNAGEKLLIVWHSVVGGVAFVFFQRSGHDVREMKAWLDEGVTSLALQGWSFGDYLSAVLLLTSAVTIAAELLLYDREGGESWYEVGKYLLVFFMTLITASQVVLAVEPLWHDALGIKVLVISFIIALMVKSRSGSGVARTFWEACLITSVMLAATIAVGPMQAVALVACIVAFHVPDRMIRYLDKDELKPVASSVQ